MAHYHIYVTGPDGREVLPPVAAGYHDRAIGRLLDWWRAR
jgi:hypothetical protein